MRKKVLMQILSVLAISTACRPAGIWDTTVAPATPVVRSDSKENSKINPVVAIAGNHTTAGNFKEK